MELKSGPGFAVLYRWRLKPEKEDQFVQAWSVTSHLLLTERGSLGSRLHRGDDGIWYSYAQWPSVEARKEAFDLGPIDAGARDLMREAIEEELPEIVLESVADFLIVI